MTKKRWAAKDKSRIVMESLTTATPVVDICKKYGLSPNTFYPWREKFIEAGKTALAGATTDMRQPCRRRTIRSSCSWESTPLPTVL